MFPGQHTKEPLLAEYRKYVFRSVTSLGFANSILYQDSARSLIAMGEAIEENTKSKTLEIKVSRSLEQIEKKETPSFKEGIGFLSAGNYKAIVEIIEVQRFEDWTMDYEMKMVKEQAIFQNTVKEETKRWLAYYV